ncbi:MAG: hypothetical protein ACLTXT_00195 [Ruminococcus callidus]
MEAMRAVVLVTCVISILSGVLDALKPNARFDRQLRLLLSVVVVLGILTPLSQGAAAFQPDWDCVADLRKTAWQEPQNRRRCAVPPEIWRNLLRRCCGRTAFRMPGFRWK